MNKKEKLALFLGMLSGDGCLSIKHNGQGYRDYPIDFCNTEEDKVIVFDNLFFDLFGIHGKISSIKRAENRRRIWHFLKYSKEIVEKLKRLGFPEGVKRDILRVPEIIKNGNKKEKAAFIHGVIITDGSVNYKRILFHSGSKLFLEDLSALIGSFIGNVKPIKEFTQREIYKSYQLTLNKAEKDILLVECPRGTMVLRRS